MAHRMTSDDEDTGVKIDKLLDNCEARLQELLPLYSAVISPSLSPQDEHKLEKITIKRSYDVSINQRNGGNTTNISESHRTQVFVGDELVESYLETLDAQLKKSQDSSAYLRVKQQLIKERDGKFISSLILKVRDKKRGLSNWDRVISRVFSALKEADDVDYVGLENVVSQIVQEITASQSVNSLTDHSNQALSRSIEVTASDARLVKRILEILPDHSPVKIHACHVLSSRLVEMPSPLLRAVAVDIVVMSPDLQHAKQVTRRALDPDAHRLVEEAVRRLALSAGQDKTKERSIGYILIESLMRHRPLEIAFISRTAKRFDVEHLFEGMNQRGEWERGRSLIKQGLNKAFGYVTLKPEKRYLIVACLVEEGHHLTARRLAPNRPDDDIALKEMFGLEIDDEEAERERQFRLETCVRIPAHVAIHWIDSLESLRDVWEQIVHPQLGPISMDVEWQPELNSGSGHNGFNPAQIIQIARPHAVFLLDVAPCSPLVAKGGPRLQFHQVMRDLVNAHDEVWGFGLEMDCKVLAKSFPDGLDWCNQLRLVSRNVGTVSHESLKSLAERVLGRTLDKEQQMSNWGRRPLLAEQVAYAATDAYVLIELQRAIFGNVYEFAPKSGSESFTAFGVSQLRPSSEPGIVTSCHHEGLQELRQLNDEQERHQLTFFCDETLKRVAKMLRAVNVDCEYEPCGGKRSIAIKSRLARSRAEKRVFVTADPTLKNLRGVYVLTAKDNEERFHELVEKFSIPLDPALILLRCTKCNGPGFDLISKEQARERKPDIVTDFVYHNESIEEFYCCNTCQNVVWQGKKFRDMYTRMGRLIDTFMSGHKPDASEVGEEEEADDA